MTPILPPLRLTGAEILRDGVMQRRSISLAEGRITRGPLPEVDLSGYLILPGIIDLHATGLTRHMAPQPFDPFPAESALLATDHAAAAQGVTLALLCQSWSWRGGIHGPDHAEAMITALEAYRPRALTDLRLKIRAETHLVETEARLIATVARHRIGYVVFTTDPAESPQPQSHMDQNPAAPAPGAMQHPRAAARDVPRHLCTLAEAFDALGVIYGSHADPDGETREHYSMIGARVAEFPVTRRAAAAAHAMMNPVVLSAPDVLHGHGPAGTAACDLIAAGFCDALASDTEDATLALAAWALVDRGLASLPKAWAMISSRPAEILRLVDRGRLDPGLRAALVVINAETRRIEATICGGRPSYLSDGAAQRFLAQPRTLRMAAE